MDYEEITEKLIRDTLKEFDLEKGYQEFLDSLIEFNDFRDVSHKKFQQYVDEKIK